MARHTIVTIECDMPHTGDKTPAHSFTLWSKDIGEYTVDLCEKCTDRLIKPMLLNGVRTIKRRGPRKR